MRISRSEYFMEVAKLTAKRSACLSRQIGAVIVKDRRVLGVGYNGPPAGMPHCARCLRKESGKDLDQCPAIHAEMNAIHEALKSTGREGLTGSDIYVTVRPCISCLKMIINCSIHNIIYLHDYPANETRIKLLEASNVFEYKFRTSKS